MRVLVMGAGALGGYFGARLQAAGHRVTYVARGVHLAAMQAGGLTLDSDKGGIRLDSVEAVAEVPERAFDVVMIMVKAPDIEAAADAVAPGVGPDTLVVGCQNGVRAAEFLATRFGEENVAPAAVYMPAFIAAPGVIRHPAAFDGITIGALHPDGAARVAASVATLQGAGVEAEEEPEIRRQLWEKLVLVANSAALTCLTRLDLGPIRAVPETRALFEAAIEEAFAVGRAVAGIRKEAEDKARLFLLEKIPDDTHASMLDDLNAGKPLELLDLSGEIVRQGRALGIATPVHDMALAVLMPYLNGRPGT
jgi:2-dehydropantoate 2-reductase